jgi:hypothetical protein
MLITPQNGNVYLDTFDENGNKIGFVCSADPEKGFITVYSDIVWDNIENKFKLKSMQVKRIYTKFSMSPPPTKSLVQQ